MAAIEAGEVTIQYYLLVNQEPIEFSILQRTYAVLRTMDPFDFRRS